MFLKQLPWELQKENWPTASQIFHLTYQTALSVSLLSDQTPN